MSVYPVILDLASSVSIVYSFPILKHIRLENKMAFLCKYSKYENRIMSGLVIALSLVTGKLQV
jgi:hypothetical protein